MTPELTVLALAVLLQVGQYVIFSITANMQVGLGYSTSPRDKHRPLTGLAGRLQRALNNHFEALALFTPTVLIISLSGQSSALTAGCAWAYLAARIVYIPAYAFGWVPWRSAIWAVGFLSTLIILVVAIL